MRASGRMLREPIISEHVHEELVVVRVDDSCDPELWFELTIRRAELLALLGRMRGLRFGSDSLTSTDELEVKSEAGRQPGRGRPATGSDGRGTKIS